MNKHGSKYFNSALFMDEALLHYLEKKDYEFITVKEICQKAGVNRSTFYLHYENMDDLLSETVEMVEKRFLEKFSGIENKSDTVTAVLTSEKYLHPYLSFIKENKKLYRLMHDKPHLFNLRKKSQELYENIFDKALSNFNVKENEKKYVFAFYTEGVLGIIKRWIDGDCKDDIELIMAIIERNTFANEKNNG